MDALRLIPRIEEDDPNVWIGKLSMALTLAAKRGDRPSEECVREFLTSTLPGPELRQILREELKR